MTWLSLLSLNGRILTLSAADQPAHLQESTQAFHPAGALEQVPVAGGGVALRWLEHKLVLAVGAQGDLVARAVSEADLQDAGRNQPYAFHLVPQGERLYTLSSRDGRSLGQPGGLVIQGGGSTPHVQLNEFTVDFSLLHDACGLHHSTHPRKLQWNERTHADIVGWSFDVFAGLLDHPEAKWLHDTFGNYSPQDGEHSDLMKELLLGLAEADTKPEYTGAIGATNLYYKHFYNVETDANYLPDLEWFLQAFIELLTGAAVNDLKHRNALTEALRYAYASATTFASTQSTFEQRKAAAYQLGLALHYVSDLSQPMHAANMINLPVVFKNLTQDIIYLTDWRHSNFEEAAEQYRAYYLLRQQDVTWDTVSPDRQEFAAPTLSGLLRGLASTSLHIFRNTLKPIVDSAGTLYRAEGIPYPQEVVAPALAVAIPLGQRASAAFLLLWSRVATGLEWRSGRNFPCHSPWAPTFFQLKDGSTWAALADQDARDTRFCLMNVSTEAGGPRYVPGGSFVHPNSNCFEVPSVAVQEQDIVVAWHARDSRSLWTGYTISGGMTQEVGWQHIELSAARIKDFTSPTVVYFRGAFRVVWADYGHCLPGGEGIYYATFNTGSRSWDTPTKIEGIDTKHSPAVAVAGDMLWMAWTGYHDGQGIFWSNTMDLQAWLIQQEAPFVSRSGPGLGVLRGVPYLFWRAPNDEVHYARLMGGNNWEGPTAVPLPDVRSHQDVRVTTLGNRLLVGWNDAWWPHYLEVRDMLQDAA